MNRNSRVSEVINSYFSKLEKALRELPTDEIEKVIYRLEEARQEGRRVFVCGEGNSAITADEFAAKLHRKAKVSTESLCANVIELSIWAEELPPEELFVAMMEGKIKEG